jgi:hypothetical protein
MAGSDRVIGVVRDPIQLMVPLRGDQRTSLCLYYILGEIRDVGVTDQVWRCNVHNGLSGHHDQSSDFDEERRAYIVGGWIPDAVQETLVSSVNVHLLRYRSALLRILKY